MVIKQLNDHDWNQDDGDCYEFKTDRADEFNEEVVLDFRLELIYV